MGGTSSRVLTQMNKEEGNLARGSIYSLCADITDEDKEKGKSPPTWPDRLDNIVGMKGKVIGGEKKTNQSLVQFYAPGEEAVISVCKDHWLTPVDPKTLTDQEKKSLDFIPAGVVEKGTFVRVRGGMTGEEKSCGPVWREGMVDGASTVAIVVDTRIIGDRDTPTMGDRHFLIRFTAAERAFWYRDTWLTYPAEDDIPEVKATVLRRLLVDEKKEEEPGPDSSDLLRHAIMRQIIDATASDSSSDEEEEESGSKKKKKQKDKAERRVKIRVRKEGKDEGETSAAPPTATTPRNSISLSARVDLMDQKLDKIISLLQ